VLDVSKSPELQAAIYAMKSADRDLRLNIYATARERMVPLWVPELEKRSATDFDRAVIVKGARVSVGTEGFNVLAATSGKALSGGFVPNLQWYADEFGARRHKVTFEQRSPLGTRYQVTKTVGRQLPGRVKDGRIGFAAASAVGTKLVAVWVTSIVDDYRALPCCSEPA
jgi:hypothetical protein